MPALELVEDKAASVSYFPTSLSSRPSSATLVFKDPSGGTKETPSVTVATVGSGGYASVSSVTSQVVVVVDDATGFVPGMPVWVQLWSTRWRVQPSPSRVPLLERLRMRLRYTG